MKPPFARAAHAAALVAGLALAILPAPARALRPPDFLARSGRAAATLELADAEAAAAGARVRTIRQVRWDAPSAGAGAAQAAAAWRHFGTLRGGAWRVLYDDATRVPLRVFGQGILAPGAMNDAAVAERAARDFLAEHLDLLAPGARVEDLVLVANVHDTRTRQRTLGFAQTAGGVRVLGAQVSVSFKNDRLFVAGSTAIPAVYLPVAVARDARTASAAHAADAALAWIERDFAPAAAAATTTTTRVLAQDGPFLLPLVGDHGVLAVRRVARVEVATAAPSPIGRWDVYVDAATGAPVARIETLRFADATLSLDVPDRWPENGRTEKPARATTLTVGGTAVTTDETGGFTFAGTSGQAVIKMVGTFVAVATDTGTPFAAERALTPDAALVVGSAGNEKDDAQIAAFVFAREAKDRAKLIAPELAWLDTQEDVVVNINDSCNAFSDGDTINFFLAGNGCANTARLADVVHHESGHSIHNHAIIPGVGSFDGALSEGVSDYLASTITDDCGMGRGFLFDERPLRDCNPEGEEAVWPRDQGEIHITGIIIAGALWDLRKNLVASLGAEKGVALADSFWYAILERAADIPSSYIEVLAADDDDGDLSNGTPHRCDIEEAFARHGLVSASAGTGPGPQLPVLTGLHVRLPVVASATAPVCAGREITGATLRWKWRDRPDVNGSSAMTMVGSDYEADLPGDHDRLVIAYQVVVAYADGSTITFPDNLADPYYELWLGEVTPIYCNSFDDGDPISEGWIHAPAAQDGLDDWRWGVPLATGAGDPPAAYSGERLIGTDLGGDERNGAYAPDQTSRMISPVIDTSGHTGVRLQYQRWLSVEDADFDHARVYADDALLWGNFATGSMEGATHHIDREWRFHDLDVTSHAQDGHVQITFELETDGGLELGGWSIDDLCLVGYVAPVCGDGVIAGIESCDDGNRVADDGCSNTCGVPGAPEEPDDSGGGCGCTVGGQSGTGTDTQSLVLLGIVIAGVAILGKKRRVTR